MKLLRVGQQVRIVATPILGTVFGPPPADDGEEREARFYQVHIEEQSLQLSREAIEEQPSPEPKLKIASPEWSQEADRFISLMGAFQANPNDLKIFREIRKSGALLGFLIPVES